MKNSKICVVGLGYVGLPLAAVFAEKFKVIGFDINESRISELKEGFDRTYEVDSDSLNTIKNNISYTSNILDTSSCNIFIIAVPTPIDSANRPNLDPLIHSSQIIGSILKKNDIVVYESTVYPGVTEEVCVPVLEESSKLKFNKDFFCGYSPERINPGDKVNTIKNIKKVTSGSTPEIAKKIDFLYKQVISAGTHSVSSIKIAEASKVIENTQRDVNIALINELAIIFDQMNIDTNEVLEAAATKWNFIDLKPGLVGGHCIGVDPYYLTFKSEQLGYRPDLILAARTINNNMSKFIVDKTIKNMTKLNKPIKNSEILILGVTFKENCPDMRNSKVVNIIEEFKSYDANVDVYDPWVKNSDQSKWYKHGIIKDPLKTDKKYDAIIVAVCHDQFIEYTSDDFKILSNTDAVIIDIKNIVEKPTWRL